MVATRIVATPIAADAMAAHGSKSGQIGVLLYHAGTPTLPGLGGHLHQSAKKSFPATPSTAAWDFLSIALAAFSADRFVLRTDAEDGWTRVISLDVALADPKPWVTQLPRLEGALRFLTGDIWQISFRDGGATPPILTSRQTDRDTISLFSGGLDSLLGALKLLEDGKRPFLVSQGSTKEVGPQIKLAHAIGLQDNRFDGRVNERWRTPYEGSTRGRSLIFFAYGVVAATAHGLNEVIVPENGLIAINPPFTFRRMGSLSTRTTHPFFLGEMEAIFRAVHLDVRLTNIFEGKTKGEMMADCSRSDIASLSATSYSCGKGKRKNGQCGRCVPCLIRRAAFTRANIKDDSAYYSDLTRSLQNDDVLAARIATARVKSLSEVEIARWVTKSGPLPTDPQRRHAIVGAVTRGLHEMAFFLDGVAWH
ncbi:MAG: Qat anti-phage system QueC-like protein QatC [Parvibaculaceae bacterium]